MKYSAYLILLAGCAVAGCGSATNPSAATEARAIVEQADERMLAADAAYQQGDQEAWASARDEALRLYRDAAQKFRDAGYDSSTETSFLQEYAETLSKSGDYDLASETYAECIALSPDDPVWYLKSAHALRELGGDAEPEAIKHYQIALSLPDTAPAQRTVASTALAEIYWDAQQFALAREQCESLESPGLSCRGILAATDIREGEVRTAFERLSSLQQVTPDDQRVLRDRIARGIDDMRQRKIAFADTAANHFAFTHLSLLAGRGQDALLAASRAVQLAGDDVAVLNIAGTLEAQSGNLGAAVDLFERSLAIDPDQTQVRDAVTQLNAALSPQQ